MTIADETRSDQRTCERKVNGGPIQVKELERTRLPETRDAPMGGEQ
jgi:hypothetical protein